MAGYDMFEVQKALYQTLTGDGALMAMITGVYDFVPEDAVFPFISMTEMTAADLSAQTQEITEYFPVLHFWSRERGYKEVQAIMSRVQTLLHDTALTVSGQEFVNARLEFSEVMRERDGITSHGVMRFRIVTQAQ